MRLATLLTAAALLGAAPAGAQVLDDFNRANAPTLGSGWTNVVGSGEVVNNTARGLGGTPTKQMAILDGGTGNTVSFDLGIAGGNVEYGAAVLNYSSVGNYFIKVQANTGGYFDSFGFYTGNGEPTGTFGFLTSGFTTGHVTASVVNGLATLTVTPAAGATQTYTYNYATTYTGTGIGLGFYGDARIDNFAGAAVTAAVPEPATWAMMLVGFGAIGTVVRRRARPVLAAA